MALFMEPDVFYRMEVPPGVDARQLGVSGFRPGITFGALLAGSLMRTAQADVGKPSGMMSYLVFCWQDTTALLVRLSTGCTNISLNLQQDAPVINLSVPLMPLLPTLDPDAAPCGYLARQKHGSRCSPTALLPLLAGEFANQKLNKNNHH